MCIICKLTVGSGTLKKTTVSGVLNSCHIIMEYYIFDERLNFELDNCETLGS
jgi:hypothetical protein